MNEPQLRPTNLPKIEIIPEVTDLYKILNQYPDTFLQLIWNILDSTFDKIVSISNHAQTEIASKNLTQMQQKIYIFNLYHANRVISLYEKLVHLRPADNLNLFILNWIFTVFYSLDVFIDGKPFENMLVRPPITNIKYKNRVLSDISNRSGRPDVFSNSINNIHELISALSSVCNRLIDQNSEFNSYCTDLQRKKNSI